MVNGVEMRLGVWVYLEDDPKPMQYVPVWKFEDLNPIPLDEEWLKKFGFKDGSYVKTFKIFILDIGGDNFKIECTIIDNSVTVSLIAGDDTSDCGTRNLNLPDLLYVHQLQNLVLDLKGKQLVDVHLPMHKS